MKSVLKFVLPLVISQFVVASPKDFNSLETNPSNNLLHTATKDFSGLALKAIPDQTGHRLNFSASKFDLNINSESTFQTMVGFGAALTEASVVNILKLPASQQEEVLQTLFSRSHGMGLSLIRVPMGSSDLADGARGEYTYDDSPENQPDPQLRYFSMARDLKTLKLLQRILAINPKVRIMINPWTAPAWMKDNHSFYRGRFESQNLAALSEYFIRTINEYHRYGLEVHYVGIQNEPGIIIDYPSMLMADEQQQEFIKLLGERLRNEGFKAKIIANDDNYVAMSRVKGFLADPNVAKNIGVAGFHCWSNDHERAKELQSKVMMFETECGANIHSSNYFYDFFWWLNLRVIENVHFGLSGVIAWNMVSDEQAGPHGAGGQGCRTCRGLVVVRPNGFDERTHEPLYLLEYNSELRALSHASRFLSRGAKRVESVLLENGSPSSALSQVAFKNPDGSYVVILGNQSDKNVRVKVSINGKRSQTIDLQAGRAITRQWQVH